MIEIVNNNRYGVVQLAIANITAQPQLAKTVPCKEIHYMAVSLLTTAVSPCTRLTGATTASCMIVIITKVKLRYNLR